LLFDRRQVLEIRRRPSVAATCVSSAIASGSIRPTGIRLPANGVQTPVVGIVSGSQMAPSLKSCAHETSDEGTENARVSERRASAVLVADEEERTVLRQRPAKHAAKLVLARAAARPRPAAGS
jgi:hypothetical protein